MANSSLKGTAKRARKQSDFPLFKHARGYWCKTVLGKHRYFGKIEDDPKGVAALRLWLKQRDWLLAGEEPPTEGESDATTVKDICNYWLSTKETDVAAGELAQKTYDEYFSTCKILMKAVGESLPAKACGPRQFDKVRTAIAANYNANGQSKRITQIRSIFNTAYEDRELESPPNFGRAFKKPKAAAFRKLRAAKGDQTYTPEEIHALLAVANVNLKPMILLGLQCGMGNEDCAALPRSAIKDGWLVWARVKNAIPRRVPLWPETVEAINAAIEHADSKGEAELCFIGARGKTFITAKKNGYRITGIFDHAKKQAKLESDRTFYDLRRTFETVAGETVDQVAVDAIMGHTPSESNMASRYRQRIGDDRLRAVTEHVRQWLGPIGGES